MKINSPIGFGEVFPGVYRSAYPKKSNFDFLKTLALKTLISLQPQDLKSELKEYCTNNNIEIIEANVGTNQEPFVDMSESIVNEIINITNDTSKRPILIFCNNGKLRTSCVMGCLRRVNNW